MEEYTGNYRPCPPSSLLDIAHPPAAHPGRHHLPLLLGPGHDGEEARHHCSLRERPVERHEAVRRPHLPRPRGSHRAGRLPPSHHHSSGWSSQGGTLVFI